MSSRGKLESLHHSHSSDICVLSVYTHSPVCLCEIKRFLSVYSSALQVVCVGRCDAVVYAGGCATKVGDGLLATVAFAMTWPLNEYLPQTVLTQAVSHRCTETHMHLSCVDDSWKESHHYNQCVGIPASRWGCILRLTWAKYCFTSLTRKQLC